MAETQERLNEKVKTPTSFEYRYPIWQCPECSHLNRFVDTFGEICSGCNTDHTLDWEKYIVSDNAPTDREMLEHVLERLDWAFKHHDEHRQPDTLTCWACKLREELREHLH